MCIKVYIDLSKVFKYDCIYDANTKKIRYINDVLEWYEIEQEYEWDVCTRYDRYFPIEPENKEQVILRQLKKKIEKIEKTRIYLLDENSKTVIKTW
jgi:hypothetical protein